MIIAFVQLLLVYGVQNVGALPSAFSLLSALEAPSALNTEVTPSLPVGAAPSAALPDMSLGKMKLPDSPLVKVEALTYKVNQYASCEEADKTSDSSTSSPGTTPVDGDGTDETSDNSTSSNNTTPTTPPGTTPMDDDDMEALLAWQKYKETFKKEYSGEMDEIKRKNYERAMEINRQHNKEAAEGKHTYICGENEFTDMDPDEFYFFYCGFGETDVPPPSTSGPWVGALSAEIPDSKDWREDGVVTPVKNQGQCGSCWAFSALASLESRQQIVRNMTYDINLSEQNLVDCAGQTDTCNGGLMGRAFDYIKRNNGVDDESSYPYNAKDNSCSFKRDNVAAMCTGYTQLPQGDENALKQAVATKGPICVAIDSSNHVFQNYKSGIFFFQYCTNKLDHGVTVVGYGSEDGNDFWIVKNSWGPTWGENGYIRMARNRNNHCGIANYCVYPLLPEESN